MEQDIERYMDGAEDEDPSEMEEDEETRDEDEDNKSDEDNESTNELKFYPDVPVVLPRSRFAGACNAETVKDG